MRPRSLLRTALLALASLGAAAPAAAAGTGGLLPVPAATIEPGQRITAAMLTQKHFYYDPARPLAVVTDPSIAVGKAARRRLPAGKPIPAGAVRAVVLVTRGKAVPARFTRGGLTITSTLLALGDGGEGDLVQARNVGSGRVVSGVVGADGSLLVSTP